MSIDGLALQELREIIEYIAEQPDGDWLDAEDARLILDMMDERDARLPDDVVEVLRGGERTISPGGGMEQRPDWTGQPAPDAGLREWHEEFRDSVAALRAEEGEG